MKTHLNLLPSAIQRRLLVRIRVRQWAVVWAVAAVALFGYYGFECHRLSAQRESLTVWQQRAATIRVVDDAVRQNRQQLRLLKEQMTAYGHLESDQCGYQLLALVSQGAGRCADQIQIQDLNFHRRVVTQTPAADKKPADLQEKPITREIRQLELQGVAVNNLAIAQFVSSLRDCTVFKQVELRSSELKDPKLDDRRSFQVDCSF